VSSGASPRLTATAPRIRPGWTLFTLLAVLEAAWLVWFLIEPLPNANNTGLPTGVKVRRGMIVLKAIPELVPDTSFRESFLGQAILELSHVENLPQRVPIVLAALLVAAAAIGLGDLVLRRLGIALGLGLAERLALAYGLGVAVLGDLALLLGRLGWLNHQVAAWGLGLCALGGWATARMHRARWPQLGRPGWSALALVSPFLVIMILGSMLPAVDFDVLEYHLQGPKEYYQAGRIAFLPHNVYTNMPFGVEMLHLLGMELLDDWRRGALVGQLLVALFAPAAAVLLAGAGARAGSPRAGAMAALVYLTTPWVYRLALIAYVEGPLCYDHAAIIWAALAWRQTAQSPQDAPGLGAWWGLLGLLAGAAMSCKYPALISAVLPVGLAALVLSIRRRSPRALLAFTLGWAIVIGPWLVKNVIDTGNPVYPLADRLFHSRHWDPAREAQWNAAHGPHPIHLGDLWQSLVDVAGRSDWQSPLYLALGSLAFARPGSRPVVLALTLYAAYIFMTWWLLTHRLDRFWLPILPALAVLAGLGADWSTSRRWAVLRGIVVGLSVFANFSYSSTALAGLNEWLGDLNQLKTDIPRRLNQPLAAVDAELPPQATILLVGQAAVFHLEHRVIYNTVFNPENLEELARSASPTELARRLRERRITHIYVDWKEIRRHRQPGGYGFTSFVQPDRFREWVRAGVLGGPRRVGPEQELYTVRGENPG